MSEDTWKLVPVEPIGAMILAGMPWLANWAHMRLLDRRNALESAYQAMIEAAPTPNREGVDLDEIARAVVEKTGRHAFAYTEKAAISVVRRVLDEVSGLKLIALARLNPPAASGGGDTP
jgi:hypothetical protein